MTATKGELEKLRIECFESPDYTTPSTGRFEAYINPQEIVISYDVEYDGSQGAGTTNSRMEFKKAKPGDLSLTFTLDGTGANGRLVDGKPLDVQKQVELFQTVTGYSGKIHRTSYLKVAWGTLSIKRCVLKSASIAYKLFHPNGVPLRAVITANFTDNSDDTTRVAMVQDESSDLTHLRLVKAGDTLPALCTAIYGDPFRYLDVARVNGLTQFRRLETGKTLIFPPLGK
ncbi:MAG: hypothetical protein HUU55_04605 [Myxococcales bacterium]|nr:hypothetical protein [Myxococcales bacterium]